MKKQSGDEGLAVIVLFIIVWIIAAWFVMIGYPLIVKIVFADGQTLINQTISYGDANALLLGILILACGPALIGELGKL